MDSFKYEIVYLFTSFILNCYDLCPALFSQLQDLFLSIISLILETYDNPWKEKSPVFGLQIITILF